jgi:hypothetical protein
VFLRTLQHDRECQHGGGNIEIPVADLYGAIFKPFDISPSVSAAYDRQLCAAIQSLGLIERFFIGINAFCNDIVARQFVKVVHSRQIDPTGE